MKIMIYANVTKDWRDRIRFPYGISQFRSYITRNFITSDQPYTHTSARAIPGDIIIWAFKEGESWYLLGDGFVTHKEKSRNGEVWEFYIEAARLYPRSVPIDELSFADAVKNSLHIGYDVEWAQYKEILEKATTHATE